MPLAMKNHLTSSLTGLVAAALFLVQVPLRAQSPSADISPKPVLGAMQAVADWQLANPSTEKQTGWIQAAGEAGFMALAGISGDAKYRDAMLAMGETNGWRPGSRMYHADDQCVGQTYTELYFLYRDPKMIAPLRKRFDAILAKPSDAPSLDFAQPDKKALEQWSWCDSLFMGPPTWVRLYAATRDERYLDFAVTNWWRTTDYLYDKDEQLFFRDSTYFNKQEANGKKVFWARGNGWVIAGIVRTLQYLPMTYPDRSRFEQLFKDMAGKILACQQPDGLWRASLLDPDSYPLKETSGSGFFTYALAWGVNQGILDRAKFEPAVERGWTALVGCVDADGKLTHVQPVGSDPKKFADDSTAPYGVGAFLLAGSEVYRLAVLKTAVPVAVFVKNPADIYRESETVEVNLGGNHAVMDGLSSRILASQTYSPEPGQDKLLFQVDLAPGETRTYSIYDTSALAAVPPPIMKTFARYVPERHDDIAWESDRIAHRMYGKALETWQAEPLTSSGIDVWIKRTRNLIVNTMYGTGVYFNTNGPSQDDFKVGHTRGDGGLGVWDGQKLHNSANWRTYKVITTGPIRSEFELTYDAWDTGNGRMVSEVKRISIDAGSNISRARSLFSSDDKSPLEIGVGLAQRPGTNIFIPADADSSAGTIDGWTSTTDQGLVVQNQSEGWMTYWQPQDFAKGTIGDVIMLPKGSVESFTSDTPNLPAAKIAPPKKTMTEGQPGLRSMLGITSVPIGQPFVYYFGAGWDQSGDFPNAAAWNNYVRHFVECRDQPLLVTVGN